VRVSREKLIDLARAETEKRAESGEVISAYIFGSVASGNPILGGTADVDLVMIHNTQPRAAHEIHPLSEDFHLDITHHFSDFLNAPTQLRVDPWLGPSMCEPIFLFDPNHFFERAQAGVRGRFHRTDHVHERALAFLSKARASKSLIGSDSPFIHNYLKALLEATNAIVTLSGFPAAGRRLVLILEERLEKSGAGGFFNRFLELHSANRLMDGQVEAWLNQWDQSVTELLSPEDTAFRARHNYYHAGFNALLSQGRPELILWNLLDKWGDSVHTPGISTPDGAHKIYFAEALDSLGFGAGDLKKRLEDLENFLDDIEEYLRVWADEHGA
jgi:hypothetical protein